MNEEHINCKSINRRTFSKSLLAGLGASPFLQSKAEEKSSLSPQGFSSFGAAKKVIYLMLPGGFSQRDSFDVLTGKYPDKYKCSAKPVATNVDGVFFAHYFKELAKRMDKLCVVRGRTSVVGAHGPGQYFVKTAYENRGADKHPHLGAWMDKMLPPLTRELPLNFAITPPSNHPGSGWLQAKHSPLPIPDPEKGLEYSTLPKRISAGRMDKRMNILQSLNSFRNEFAHGDIQAVSMRNKEALTMMRTKDLEAFDLNKEPKWKRKAYGETELGNSLLLAKRLIERGVRHVEVNSPVGDPHSTIYEAIPGTYGKIDKAVSALLDDLEKSGLMDETLFVLTSEFGRTPFINEKKGRDHWPSGFSCLLAGAGVKKAHVYGKTSVEGKTIEGAINTQDWCTTIAHIMGLPWHKTFYSPSSRPFKVGGKSGKPHSGILA